MRTIQRSIVSVLIYSADGKLLMGRKDPKAGGVYPDCWHLPGGGVEERETHKEAVVRELKEETGIIVSDLAVEFVANNGGDTVIRTLRQTGEKVRAVMKYFLYKVVIADIPAHEIAIVPGDDLVALKWFAMQELHQIKLTPPSEQYFRKIGSIA